MKKLTQKLMLILAVSTIAVSCGKNVSGSIGIYDNKESKAEAHSVRANYYECSQRLYPQCVTHVSRNIITGQYFYSTQCFNQYQNCLR